MRKDSFNKDSFSMVSEDSIRGMFQDECSGVSASEQLIQRTLNLVQSELESKRKQASHPVKKNWWQRASIGHAAFALTGFVLVLVIGTLWFPRVGSQKAMGDETIAAALKSAGDANQRAGLTDSGNAAMPAATENTVPQTAEAAKIADSENTMVGATAYGQQTSSVIIPGLMAAEKPPESILQQIAEQIDIPDGAALLFDRLVSVKTLMPDVFRSDQSKDITVNQELISDISYFLVPVADNADTLLGIIPLYFSQAAVVDIQQLFQNAAFADTNGWFSTGFLPVQIPMKASVFSESSELKRYAESIVGPSSTDVTIVDIGFGSRFAILLSADGDDWVLPVEEGIAYRTEDYIRIMRGQP